MSDDDFPMQYGVFVGMVPSTVQDEDENTSQES